MTKDQMWLQDRAAQLQAALEALGVVVTDAEALEIVTSRRKSLAQSRYCTPAGARAHVSDSVLTSWAEAIAQQRRREAAPGGSRSVDLLSFATALSGLLEGSSALAYEGSQCSVVDAVGAAAAFAAQLSKDPDPRAVVSVEAPVLVRAIDALRISVRALECSVEREHQDYVDAMMDEPDYADYYGGYASRGGQLGRRLSAVRLAHDPADADVDARATDRISELRGLAARLEVLYVGPVT